MLAGNMPALPDNPRNEFPQNYETGSRKGNASMLLAQADMLSACMTGLALTAICVDVRCARTQMHESAPDRNENASVTRRGFLGISLMIGVSVLAGKPDL